ncbi:MAG TPA: hypothetical protein DDW50_19735 [Firmicutes bacterium]|jgi:hypothetical protein|nr:hypothetical protein [Bacillota bacterium]
MKKLIVLILTLMALFTFGNLTMAQVYPADDAFSSASYPFTVWNHSSDWHTANTWHSTDTWYSVTPEAPYVEIYYNDRDNINQSNPRLGVEGYANEQTFF